MFRLLIVDDEPIIVDGLFELFAQHVGLEVHRAYDALEALDIVRKTYMDIVLADIEMPEMNGLELQKHVQNQWPRCKFIFLTGYSDFSFIHSSIRQGAFDYVLKTEGDDPILAAVDRAVRQIEETFSYEQIIKNAEDQLVVATPLIRKEYWLELLTGEISGPAERRRQFDKLGITLDSDKPYFMGIGRIDEWREDIGPGDKSLFLYSVNNIVEEILTSNIRVETVFYAQDRLLWLLQPKEELGAEAAEIKDWNRYLLGLFETVQSSCSQFLRLACSFVVSGRPHEWERLSSAFERLTGLFVHGLGSAKEILLSDMNLAQIEEAPADRGALKRFPLLEQYLDQKNEEKFFGLYAEIMATVQEQGEVRTSQALEIYYSLASAVFSYLNRWGLLQKVTDALGVRKLFTIQEFASWDEITRYFADLFRMLFEWRNSTADSRTSEVVITIHDYVDKNMSKDLSLVHLADLVYLTPFYLSRLYKQTTGRSISDYITGCRLQTAKELLSGKALKIHEVGERIGFESPSYFTRFFKKLTGMTPQEYRDSAR
ncbi:response regulator transcription factor [Cohnella lupini]|uniref:Two-component system response regulator YesN n=1 Tax=Cohnella lupini TaxID=1294267 RepID=A0A3D9I4M6_9BACL|nr:response regulator [Cohnella lupini]RED56595.1 two-component system response regulator YesN [Cohnella lupini]